MEAHIRTYEPRDLAACRELWRELTERHREIYDSPDIGGDRPDLYFDKHLERPDLAGLWVAEANGEVVALVGLLRKDDEAEVEPIVVKTGCRSQGLGRALLRHVTAEAQGRGASSLNIRPVARNVEAIRLFVAEGFDVMGHVQLFKTLQPGKSRWRPGVQLHGISVRF